MRNYIPGREYTMKDFIPYAIACDGGILCVIELCDYPVIRWECKIAVTENLEFRLRRMQEHMTNLSVETCKDFLDLQPPRKGKKAKK